MPDKRIQKYLRLKQTKNLIEKGSALNYKSKKIFSFDFQRNNIRTAYHTWKTFSIGRYERFYYLINRSLKLMKMKF